MFRNPLIPFTYNYSQPEEYRFSIDSIEMPWEVAQYLQSENKNITNAKVLDLCAGCGVLGLELNFHLPQLQKIDFVEVQAIYEPHFLENKKMAEARAQSLAINVEPQFRFINSNYEKILLPEFEKHYELIVCNPPYFFPDQGKMSPSDFKNRCRFFIDSGFKELIQTIDFCLAMEGEAFLLLRDQEDHDRDVLGELKKQIKGSLKCENLTMIRGTFLLRLYR